MNGILIDVMDHGVSAIPDDLSKTNATKHSFSKTMNYEYSRLRSSRPLTQSQLNANEIFVKMDIFCRNCLRKGSQRHFLKYEEIFYRLECNHLICENHYGRMLYSGSCRCICGCKPKDRTKPMQVMKMSTDDFSGICDKGHFIKDFVSQLRENRRIDKDVNDAVSLFFRMIPSSTFFRKILSFHCLLLVWSS